MTKKKELKTSGSQAKSLKASCQLRDAKGHFIKGYKSRIMSVDPAACSASTVVSVVNDNTPVPVNSWYQKLGEVAEKLTIVISSLDKLADFKDYISGNKNSK